VASGFAYLWRAGRYFTNCAVNLVTGAIQRRALPPPEDGLERREEREQNPPDDRAEQEQERPLRDAEEIDQYLNDPNRPRIVPSVTWTRLRGDPEGTRTFGRFTYRVDRSRDFRTFEEVIGAIDGEYPPLERRSQSGAISG
jgi:hypothetical protein